MCLLGSHGSHFFWLTRISRIPRYCFVGGKSHRCFCVWACVWAVGLHGARSHGFIFQTHRTHQTYQTYRTNRTDWAFKK